MLTQPETYPAHPVRRGRGLLFRGGLQAFAYDWQAIPERIQPSGSLCVHFLNLNRHDATRWYEKGEVTQEDEVKQGKVAGSIKHTVYRSGSWNREGLRDVT